MANLTNLTANGQAVVKIFASVFKAGVSNDLISQGAALLDGGMTKAQLYSGLLTNSNIQAAFPLYTSVATSSAFVGALVDNVFANSGVATAYLDAVKANWTVRLDTEYAGARGTFMDALLSALMSSANATSSDTSIVAVYNTINNRAEVGATNALSGAAPTFTTMSALQTQTSTVTNDSATIATAVATAVTGSTFTLTTAADSGSAFTGTSNGDTYNAVIGTDGLVSNGTTLNPGDNLNGGAGTDTLAVSVSGTNTGAATQSLSAVTLSSIERLTFSNFETSANNSNFDLSTATGLTTIAQTSSSASGDTVITGVQNIVAAEMSNGAGDLSLTYTDASVAGTADTQTLTVSGVTGGTFTAAAATTGGIETLAITSSGSAANVLTGITNATSLTSITVAGAQDLTLGALGAAVTKVNGSTFTGGLTLSATTGVDYSITGGAGNDVLTVTAANITSADTITGGTGTDTIKLGALVTAAVMANVTGFEVLEETTNMASGQTVDGLLSGVTKLVSSATSGGNDVTFTNLGSTVTDLQVAGTEGIIASLKTNTSADAITLTYGTSGTGAAGFTVAGQTTLNDFETISIVSQGGANTTGAFSATSLTTLNASGSKALTISAMGVNTALATINASGMTADFVMTDNASTTASSITGGTANDTLFGSTKADSISGGAGNDIINAGAGADSINGGDGNDTFNVTTVTDFTTGVETVVGGAGNDTLSIAQAATTTTITAANLGAISGIETLSINSTSAAASVTLTDAVFTSNGQALAIVDADLTQGTLTIDGSALTSANSVSVTANTSTGVNDTLTGGAGNDSFTFSTANGLEATDTVVGGTGTDTISLTATGAVTANLTGVRTVENITTTGTGGNIAITVGSDSVIAASSTLTTSAASSTTTGNTLNYDGSAVTTATKVQNVTGSAGTDTIIGGSGNDILAGGDSADKLTGGAGIDSISGGAGDDLIYVNTAAQFISLASVETVSGGAGNDTLVFATGVGFTVAAADLAGINSVETIQFLSTASNDTLTLTDAVFTANGATSLKIDAAAVTTGNFGLAASGLSAANSLTVTRTDNGANGGDSIVFGAGNDTLKVATSILDNTTTTLTGGTGNDTITLTETGQTVTMTALTTGFEKIDFGADIAAAITTVDANVASGVTFTVDGAALITTNALTFNGAAELDGKFSITGGAAADILTGGALVDTISGGAGADTITGGKGADSLAGGAGADVFAYTSASVTDSTGTTYDTITDFTTTSDKIKVALDYSAISAGVDVNANLVASTADLSAKRGEFVYDTATSALSINVNNDNLITTQDIKIGVGTVVAGDVDFVITGSAFGDTLTGGAGADTIDGGAGADSITGGAGNDSITAGASTDTILGGSGKDTIILGAGGDADVVGYSQAAGADGGTTAATADVITGFVAGEDTIAISGALKTAIDLSGANAITDAKTSTGAAGNVATAATTELLFSVTANSALATADFGTMTAVATALNAMFTFATAPTGPVLALIAGSAATAHGLYLYTEAGTSTGDNAVDASELVLLGVFTSDAALAAGAITIA